MNVGEECGVGARDGVCVCVLQAIWDRTDTAAKHRPSQTTDTCNTHTVTLRNIHTKPKRSHEKLGTPPPHTHTDVCEVSNKVSLGPEAA